MAATRKLRGKTSEWEGEEEDHSGVYAHLLILTTSLGHANR